MKRGKNVLKRIAYSVLFIVVVLIILILILLLIRLINEKDLDDICPGIQCDEELLMKADVLWIIPNFRGKRIDQDPEFCAKILALNKTIGMHGITHEYKEFYYKNITQEELDEGIALFENCFGFKPKMFKPPQLFINKENKKLIEENGIEIRGIIHKVFRKEYHCNDTGLFSNKFEDML